MTFGVSVLVRQALSAAADSPVTRREAYNMYPDCGHPCIRQAQREMELSPCLSMDECGDLMVGNAKLAPVALRACMQLV